MTKISEEIEKLQNDSIDLDLQTRLAAIKRNMKGLDSSTDKYNNLVKEVLNLQIKRLENEKKKLTNANLQEKVSIQSTVTKLEKEVQKQIVKFTKYKLDTKANASLKNKTNVTLKDLENVFHSFIDELSESVGEAAGASINLSKKKLYRSAINSKRDKQEAYYMGTTGSSESATRKGIAGVEVEKLLESEKELVDSLKEAFTDIKETIESTDSKREFDIQSEKFNLLIEVLNKNRGIIADSIEKDLDKLIGIVSGEVKNKSGLLSRIGGKYEDIKADAERLGITEKLNAAGNSLARGLGKLDGELGNFAESILSSIEGIDRFATQLFKIPETFNNFKKFLGGTFQFLSGKGGPDQTEKLKEIKQSIDTLGEKFTTVVNDKTEQGKEHPEIKKFAKGLKGTNKLTKTQNEQLTKTNKLTKISTTLMTALNVEMSGLVKRFGLLRVKSFFTGFGTLLSRYSGYILTGALAVYTAGKALGARAMMKGILSLRIGFAAMGKVVSSLVTFTIPLLTAAITGVTSTLAAIGAPGLIVIGALAAVGVAAYIFRDKLMNAIDKIIEVANNFAKKIKDVIDYIKSFIPDLNPFDKDDDFWKGLDVLKGWANKLNPFGASESEKQAQMMTQQVQEKMKSGGNSSPNLQSNSSYDGKPRIIPTSDSDKFMEGLISAETGEITDKRQAFDESRFIRTGAGSDSSAYGPLQITKGLAEGSVKNGAFDNDPELKKWVQEKFIPHGRKMLKADYNDPVYGKYGKGDLSGAEDRAMYEKMGRLLSKNALENNKGNVVKATGEWRLGDSKKDQLGAVDPKYRDKVLASIQNNESQQMKTVMDQRKQLQYTTQQQMAMNQVKNFAQAIPQTSINQSTNIQNAAGTQPFTPIDLRNTESTFCRNMDIDFRPFLG